MSCRGLDVVILAKVGAASTQTLPTCSSRCLANDVCEMPSLSRVVQLHRPVDCGLAAGGVDTTEWRMRTYHESSDETERVRRRQSDAFCLFCGPNLALFSRVELACTDVNRSDSFKDL